MPGKEHKFMVDTKLGGILPWHSFPSFSAQEAHMPWTCFNYPADVPPGTRKHHDAESALPGLDRMTGGVCFRY